MKKIHNIFYEKWPWMINWTSKYTATYVNMEDMLFGDLNHDEENNTLVFGSAPTYIMSPRPCQPCCRILSSALLYSSLMLSIAVMENNMLLCPWHTLCASSQDIAGELK